MGSNERSSAVTTRIPRRVLVLAALVASVAASAAGAVAPARASNMTLVDCAANSGALATALATANDGDTLEIQGTCKGTFLIAHNLTLAGSGGATLDGQAADTVLTISSGKVVVVTELTVTGGLATSFFPGGENGGGIWNNGTLTLIDSTVSGNTTSFSGNGGGIFNLGTLTLTNSTVSGNTASFSGGGAGIWNNGTLTLTDSTVSGNTTNFGQGGGIYNFGGTLTLSNSAVSDNTSGVGGGITNRGTVTLTNSTLSGNTTRFGGSGGGIWNLGTVRLTNSTVSGNTASFWFGSESGGGIYNLGTLTVENTTISANRAVRGGGLFAVLPATLVNTIVSNQTAGGNCAGGGLISDGGYNLEDGRSCGFSTANNSLPETDPLLDPAGLKNNGGPTQTIALQPGSPAINAVPRGVNGCGTTLTTDQRGVARPQGPRCDIGAFESVVLDTTSPVLDLPSVVAADAKSPMGAPVEYAGSVSATDETDGSVPVSCTPPSGSTFPIGDTAVQCTATDAAGNTSSGSFTVHVKGAAEQLADLGKDVIGVGPGTSLAAKVKQAQTSLAGSNLSDTCSAVAAFVNEVSAQSDRTIPAGQAIVLILRAQRIRLVLGGPCVSANLIVNPGAEAGGGGDGSAVVAAPGWTTSGNFTVVNYVLGEPGGWPGPTSPGPSNRGANFFSGGPDNASSSASQTISLTGYAGQIDRGALAYSLTGWLGGFDSQNDNATLSVSFEDKNGGSLGTSTIGPVLADDRGNERGFVYRDATGLIPIGTRSVAVQLVMTRTAGVFNDGYADNLSLVITP